MIAFTHIQKAGGTTFTDILRRNFLFRHMEVLPLRKNSRLFSIDELKAVKLFNPWIKSIAGECISPVGGLEKIQPNILYITILRCPIDRYISHYQYQVNKMGKTISFEDWLDIPFYNNFQTKQIAIEDNLGKAIKLLKQKYFAVGLLEQYDEFLFSFKKKLALKDFDISYKQQNVATDNTIRNEIMKDYGRYKDKIIRNNHLDIKLYEYAKYTLLKNELNSYRLESLQSSTFSSFEIKYRVRKFLHFFFRNLYYKPLFMICRAVRKS